MDKNAIKEFATEARRELMARVSQRALLYGISPGAEANPEDDVVEGRLLSSTEKRQRAALIEAIKEKSYDQVMEEVAYTWFNRFCALRFMEVNGYLPGRVRVFTDENNAFKPQILAEAIHLEMEGLDREKVFAYKEADANDDLYKYLLITQCNALSDLLPKMFQKIADATELLFPDNLLREGSVLYQMIETIPEEDWKDAVQIIGWLFQYYNSEKKDEVFAALKKNVKISKDNIPAATQLFTPDWIVRYMVENSLGRLWLEGHPDEALKSNWKYYLDEAEQEPEVEEGLEAIRKEYREMKPEDIRCIDPCCGSGHILAYMFDVLVQIYEAYGYTTREAVASIVEKNLYGLDIDDRAAQLSYLTVMMKACQYDKRFLRRKIQPHVYSIVESNHVDRHAVEYFCNGDAKLKEAMDTIIKEPHDAKEYGSIITVSDQDWDALYARFDEIEEEIDMHREVALSELLPLVQTAQALAQKYDVVVTNPPYMGASGMSAKLADYVKKNYPDSKSDLFAVFIERGNQMVVCNGINCMVTMQSWMFLSSFKKFREKWLRNKTITNLMHMENMVMGIAFGTAVTAFRNNHIPQYKGTYNCIKYKDIVDDVPKEFPIKVNRFAQVTTDNFSKIPGSPVAYWVSDAIFKAFDKGKMLGTSSTISEGIKTGDNNKFLRLWYEVDATNFSFATSNVGYKWYPHHKGGEFRKWYGNRDWVINWENNGAEITASDNSGLQGKTMYFNSFASWSKISSKGNPLRIFENNYLFDSGAPALHNDRLYVSTAFLNSVVGEYFLKIISPTLNLQVGDVKSVPLIFENENSINEKVSSCVDISKVDWDSFETSWDFKQHPLLRKVPIIAEAFDQWKNNCDSRFNLLKANEEELNRIFIDIYGLQDELTPEVEDKDVTVRKADLERDIKSFISYAVGCMFGRYSPDVEGLAYAGGDWDESKYRSFPADRDNIIPISDDVYFEDDILSRFVKFVEVVYGESTLEENLAFIAEALGGKGQPRDVIRNYFLKRFFKDHCKTYQKRPIYWLFDSGKKNGFKCLIYMHRYSPDTIARIRTDYVHEQQARYRSAIDDLEARMEKASSSERVKLNKKLKAVTDQAKEVQIYEEKIHHLADQMIAMDLDDGVVVNYAKFQDVLAKIK